MKARLIAFLIFSFFVPICVAQTRAAFSYNTRSIDEPGVTILKKNLDNLFQIRSSNSVLNMNGKTITGGILVDENLRNVTIMNGIIDSGTTFTSNAIHVQPGCENIQIKNVNIKNAQRGIFYDNVFGGVIDQCQLSATTTAVYLNQSHNITVYNTIASRNSDIAFNLVSSTTCCFQECKALSTGQGNAQIIDATIAGFLSVDGHANIFEGCIANSTQALSTTDSQSLVAGFALRGDEAYTKIIDCEAANAQTDISGVTIPYGILLEAQFDGLVSVTADIMNGSSSSPQQTFAWSPDGKYLAVALDLDTVLVIYEFDRVAGVLNKIIEQSNNAGPRSVAWHPDGVYLAVGFAGSLNLLSLVVYEFNGSAGLLTAVVDNQLFGVNIPSVAWSSDGAYLAAALFGSDLVQVYTFDSVTETLTTLVNASGNGQISVSWSPDDAYLAAAISSDNVVRVYSFDATTPSLTAVDSESATLPVCVDWSPDGKYLAAAIVSGTVRVYEFDRAAQDLILRDSKSGTTPTFVNWTADGNYLAAALLDDNLVQMYSFDRSTKMLTPIGSASGGGPISLAFSPDSANLAVAFSADELFTIYQALTFPSKNLINNNTVYCNSGGNCPYGVGISGSSIQNLIIGNTAYSNPIMPSIVGSNYVFVTNVFNPLFGRGPSLLQNISVDDGEVIPTPENLAPILNQAKSKLCDLITQFDVIAGSITSIADTVMPACQPTEVSSSPISAEGFYCLNQDISSGGLAITASNVVLNLNNRRVTGGITISNQDQVTIMNGVVVNSGSNAIAATNCTNIMLKEITAKDSTLGVNFTNVGGGTIENCTFSSNTTGMQLNSSYKIVADSCMAVRNTNAGFDLISSTTNCFTDCKALSTGEGNNNITDQTIFGFVSNDGYGNIFERCIANATQALSTTDYDSLVAGFALRGSEGCSKIIECESANAATSPDGYTVPTGILLQATTENLLGQAVIEENFGIITSFGWSPNAKYVVIPTRVVNAINTIDVYEFDRLSSSLILVAQSADVDFPTAARWNPDGVYISVVEVGTLNAVLVYDFNLSSTALSRVAISTEDLVAPITCNWSPDGNYILVGDNDNTVDNVFVYEFDRVSYALTRVAQASDLVMATNNPTDANWSPNGKYIAVADNGVDQIFVYEFDPSSSTLIRISESSGIITNPQSVQWSPDGRYLAVADRTSFVIYEFDPSSSALAFVVQQTGFTALVSSNWSPDGRYIVGSDRSANYEIYAYEFNRPNSLMFIAQANLMVDIDPVDPVWSPDGAYVGVYGGEFGNFNIYPGLTFPSKNVIKDNTVYCNSGGNLPYGVGISGSSISNLIIGNTTYSNPFMPFMVGQNYVFVTNVFNPLFQNEPSLLQNLSIDCDQPICAPIQLSLLLEQALARVSSAPCASTQITSSDIASGTVSLTEAGNYCIASDLTTDLVISTSGVFLDINQQCITGIINIATAEHVRITNGRITPAADTGGASPTPCINVASTALRVEIDNLEIISANETTGTNAGRDGIQIAGHNVEVHDCTIKSGAGFGADRDGGNGITVQNDAQEIIIRDCVITTGGGGNSASATAAGDGGHGIAVQTGGVNVEILNCLIAQTGNGGNNSSTGNGGNGGNGIDVASGAVDVAVTDCTFRNTGAGGTSSGGTPGIGGYAVNDRVTTAANLSQIFKNFAHNIASATKFDIQAAGIEKGVQTPNPPTSAIINPFANVYT